MFWVLGVSFLPPTTAPFPTDLLQPRTVLEAVCMADTHHHGNSCQVLGWATDKSGDCLCKFASWHFMNSGWVRSRCYANAAVREQLRTSRLNEPVNQVCYVPRPELPPDGTLEHNCSNHTTVSLGRLPSAFTYKSKKRVDPEGLLT